MTGRDYRLGRVSPGLAAERIPVIKATGGQDRRTGAEYLAALERETEASLRSKTVWPYTGPERWRAPTRADLPRGQRPDKGRWA